MRLEERLVCLMQLPPQDCQFRLLRCNHLVLPLAIPARECASVNKADLLNGAGIPS